MRARPLGLLLLLAACGGPARQPGNETVDVPVPSGPPVAQQVDPSARASPSAAPAWESAAGSEGTALRLTGPDGRLLLSIACLGSPARLTATAPVFTAIGSEERFSLGLGQEPVILVADLERSDGEVTAEGAVPDRFEKLLERAPEISALYGTQRIGPVPAPSKPLKESLAKACSGSK